LFIADEKILTASRTVQKRRVGKGRVRMVAAVPVSPRLLLQGISAVSVIQLSDDLLK